MRPCFKGDRSRINMLFFVFLGLGTQGDRVDLNELISCDQLAKVSILF